MKDELTEATVRAALQTRWIGRSYQYLERAGSTNDLLKQQVADGAPDNPPSGAVVLTEYQEQGRGRLQRRWEAPSHTSLLFSVLFRPDWPANRLSWLTMMAGLAVVKALEKETHLPLALKWPNDVLVKHLDTWHKVCGILLEGSLSPDQLLDHAVLGIGINVNIPQANLPRTSQPAASLMMAAGYPVPRLKLFTGILWQLEHLYETAESGQSPQQQWNERLVTLGQRVAVTRMGQEVPLLGTAESTDEWGQLLVRDDEGMLHAIMAADVSLRGV